MRSNFNLSWMSRSCIIKENSENNGGSAIPCCSTAFYHRAPLPISEIFPVTLSVACPCLGVDNNTSRQNQSRCRPALRRSSPTLFPFQPSTMSTTATAQENSVFVWICLVISFTSPTSDVFLILLTLCPSFRARFRRSTFTVPSLVATTSFLAIDSSASEKIPPCQKSAGR